jgi:hypothetical protein
LCDKLREDEKSGASSTNGDIRNVYKILVEKSDGKRPFGRRRRRWQDNIKIDIK